jgi:uncharacterized protein (TIGR02466 family)
MSVEHWFSVPIYFSKLEGDVLNQVQSELKKAIGSISEFSNPWDDTVQTNFSYTKDNDFLVKTPFFKDVIHEEVVSYLRGIDTVFKVSVIDIVEAWVNLYPKNAYQNFHIHPTSDISGCYYFATNEEDGDIKFKTPSLVTRHSKVAVKPVEVTYKPQVGKFLLFPSYLEHAVMQNTTNHERISVAFNVTLR